MRDLVHCPKCGSKKTKKLRYVYECRICHEKWSCRKSIVIKKKESNFKDYYFERILQIANSNSTHLPDKRIPHSPT